MKTKLRRADVGFTMMEMMLSIALLAIVAALVFVNVIQYQRSYYQREMDETAKEIFIVAQNHLTVADSLGTLSGRTNGEDGALSASDGASPYESPTSAGGAEPTTPTGPGSSSADAGIYYYVVPADAALLDDKASALNAMLPQGSIDGSIRTGGSYIIRYQYSTQTDGGATAKVLGVFYADPNGRFPHSFNSGEYGTLFAQSGDYIKQGADGEAARADYAGAIIGYYGGESASPVGDRLSPPQLIIHNGDELTAEIKVGDIGEYADCAFEVYITGLTSKKTAKVDSLTAAQVIQNPNVVIDSIARSGKHFGERFLDQGLIPGENIAVQVFALDNGTANPANAAGRVSKSAKRTTNSLFGSLSRSSLAAIIDSFASAMSIGGAGSTTEAQAGGLLAGGSPASGNSARISSIRHLENLSKTVSNYDSSKLGAEAPVAYQQATDLSWPGFCDAVEDATGEEAKVYEYGSSEGAASFVPVNATGIASLVYEGNARSISGAVVNASGNAGLFGSLIGANVHDLELVDFQVAATGESGSAGALAGSATSAEVTRVLVRNEAGGSADGSVNVSARAGSAGGLIGQMTGGTVAGCAAAVKVESESGAAGGLVGSVDASAAAGAAAPAIEYSYSGGHTDGGKYADGYDANVSGSAAGGLVGSLGAGVVVACYSTCSAQGPTAGGLVGDGGAGPNCYALGAVNGQDWSAAGLDAAAFDAAIGGGKEAAAPYDPSLFRAAGVPGAYPFKTVSELPGFGTSSVAGAGGHGLTKHLDTHYGDWPAGVVTYVENARG